jgi:molybdate transport system substrate-binding protein
VIWAWLGCAAEEAELTVYAASSLTDVLPRAVEAWRESADGAPPVTYSFESSSRLAKQVAAGAPADLLITADRESMDTVSALLLAGSRRDLLGNALVVVVPADAAEVPRGAAELRGISRLALGAESVPAGRYARAALASEGVWTELEAKVVSGDNVRTTLAWVGRGEADAGVVYATDAAAEPAVRVAFTFPEGSHPPIVYPAAVVAGSERPEEAQDLLTFLASPAGQAVFAAEGFRGPPVAGAP